VVANSRGWGWTGRRPRGERGEGHAPAPGCATLRVLGQGLLTLRPRLRESDAHAGATCGVCGRVHPAHRDAWFGALAAGSDLAMTVEVEVGDGHLDGLLREESLGEFAGLALGVVSALHEVELSTWGEVAGQDGEAANLEVRQHRRLDGLPLAEGVHLEDAGRDFDGYGRIASKVAAQGEDFALVGVGHGSSLLNLPHTLGGYRRCRSSRRHGLVAPSGFRDEAASGVEDAVAAHKLPPPALVQSGPRVAVLIMHVALEGKAGLRAGHAGTRNVAHFQTPQVTIARRSMVPSGE